jgi:hypothetical protein
MRQTSWLSKRVGPAQGDTVDYHFALEISWINFNTASFRKTLIVTFSRFLFAFVFEIFASLLS